MTAEAGHDLNRPFYHEGLTMKTIQSVRKKIGPANLDCFKKTVSNATRRIMNSQLIKHYIRKHSSMSGFSEVTVHQLATLVLKQLLADHRDTPIASWSRKDQLGALTILIFVDSSFCPDGSIDLYFDPNGVKQAIADFDYYPKAFMSIGDPVGSLGEYEGSFPHELAVRDLQRRQRQMEISAPPQYIDAVEFDEVFPGMEFSSTRSFAGEFADEEGVYIVYGTAAVLEPADHVWVKLPGGIVFDGMVQRFYDEAAYLAAGYVEVARFTYIEEILLTMAIGDDPFPAIVGPVTDPRAVAIHLLEQYGVSA